MNSQRTVVFGSIAIITLLIAVWTGINIVECDDQGCRWHISAEFRATLNIIVPGIIVAVLGAAGLKISKDGKT